MTAAAETLPPAPERIDWFSPWTMRALADVGTERLAQDDRWNPERIPGMFPAAARLPVLVEEVGEVATELQRRTDDNGRPIGPKLARRLLRDELVQVAAVAVRWIEALDVEAEQAPPAPTVTLPVGDLVELHKLAGMVAGRVLTDDEFRRALEVGGRVEDVLQAAGAQPSRPFGMTEVHDVA